MSAPTPTPSLWTVPKQVVLSLCFTYGRIIQRDLDFAGVKDPDGISLDGPRMLWAIAGNESHWGANCKPRFEPAYAPSGLYYQQSQKQRDLYAQFGSDAASSFGPWQILPCNAPGFKPEELGLDPDKACQATIGFIRRYVLGAKRPNTLGELLDVYNSGTWHDAVTPAVQKYVETGTHYYLTEAIDE
jgi:hypothetical protein